MIAEGFQTYKFGDLIEKITKGTTPTTLGGGFVDHGINFIKSEAISYDGRIDRSTFVCIDSETHEKLKRSQLQKGDILFSMAGIFLGKNAIVTEDILPANTNQALAIIRLKQEKATPKFVHYYLRQKDVVKQINSISGQSAQPNINFEEIKSIEINLPEIQIQNEISSILSSLDDKIELNLQMNKTLEAIAQEIFKEWFVNFRFPGFDGELVDGLPKGWKKVSLSNKADIQIGRTPPRMEAKWFSNDPSDIKWISIKDMGEAGVYINNTAEYLTYEAKSRFRIPEIPVETVILSFKLTVGRVCITTEKMLSNEAIAQIRTDLSTAYIYCYLFNFDYKSLGSTSSIATAVNSKSIKDLPLLLPTVGVLNQFRDTVSPLLERIKVNCSEIQSLEKIRNLLLPKLMNGQIRVTI